MTRGVDSFFKRFSPVLTRQNFDKTEIKKEKAKLAESGHMRACDPSEYYEAYKFSKRFLVVRIFVSKRLEERRNHLKTTYRFLNFRRNP